METRKLTQEQIGQLFEFCQKRKVREFEIQAELVDHLASSIENELEQDTALSFYEALNIAYRKFGENGFAEIIKSKKKAFRHKYNILFLKHLLTFFKWPRVILTLLLLTLLYLFFQYFNWNQILLETLGWITILTNLTFNVLTQSYQENRETIFLISYYYKRLRISIGSILFLLFFLVMHILNNFPQTVISAHGVLISFFIILALITTYILAIYIPRQLKKDFLEQYPEMACPIL